MSAGNRMQINARDEVRPQRSGQRPDYRSNPYNGVPNGTSGFPDDTSDADDLTAEAIGGFYPAPFSNLAALKADGTYGDGNLAYGSGADFAADKFIVLRDQSLAHYASSAWVVGAA